MALHGGSPVEFRGAGCWTVFRNLSGQSERQGCDLKDVGEAALEHRARAARSGQCKVASICRASKTGNLSTHRTHRRSPTSRPCGMVVCHSVRTQHGYLGFSRQSISGQSPARVPGRNPVCEIAQTARNRKVVLVRLFITGQLLTRRRLPGVSSSKEGKHEKQKAFLPLWAVSGRVFPCACVVCVAGEWFPCLCGHRWARIKSDFGWL